MRIGIDATGIWGIRGGLVNYTLHIVSNLIKIDNEPGNFTFADSVGYFEIQLPSGTYDIYAERVFYEDNTIYGVTLEDNHDTVVDFNMTCTLPPVSVTNNELQIVNYKLSNYPNPFNPNTTISYQINQSGKVELSVYNIKGQKVKTLINEFKQTGKHSVVWNGKDNNSKRVSSGVYLYKITSSKKTVVKKMLMLK